MLSLSLPTAQPNLPTPTVTNLVFVFDFTHAFSRQISTLSSSCHHHIRDLRRIRDTIDFTTASTIATYLVN